MPSRRVQNNTPNPRKPNQGNKGGVSVSFLVIVLFILVVLVFILFFKDPLSELFQTSPQTSQNSEPKLEHESTDKDQQNKTNSQSQDTKTGLIIDGEKLGPPVEPSASPLPQGSLAPQNSVQNTPVPQKTPTASATERPKTSPTQSKKQDLKRATLYYVKVEDSGTMKLETVYRNIVFGDSPLSASLLALLNGPSSSEISSGLISLIPGGTRLLSAVMQDNIAYLSFNESFMFNPLGSDGLQAQLKQVVYSSMEFPTVKGVQILIEGRKQQYLGGDGIFIGSPLNKSSFR